MKDLVVYVFFALTVLAYVWNIPVTAAFVLREDGAGVGFGVFVYDGAVRRAEKGKRKTDRKNKRKLPEGGLRALLYFIKKAKVDRIFMDGVICTGDAAESALITGAAWALAAAFPEKITANVLPDFGEGRTLLALSGIMRAKLGHITVMGAMILKSGIKERYGRWKNTRSKG